ncbi:MAG: hypothetical protein ACRDZY_10300, partial [Acidimicrobiales bacterium]
YGGELKPSGGDVTPHRLTYPDGPAQDTEALRLDRSGTPYLVTKDILGNTKVYRPSGPLATPGLTPTLTCTRLRTATSPRR